MKYLCFAECVEGSKRITSFPCPYFNNFQDIPSPFFTLEDVENHSGFNSISRTNRNRISRAKPGTFIRIGRLSRATAHYIIVLDEESDLYKVHMLKDRLQNEIHEIREQLKVNDLYNSLQSKMSEMAKINKQIKEIVKGR